ncbi:MAG: DsbE family thiol:disulfide interchange protein [Gammaproteobacteria bacterium]
MSRFLLPFAVFLVLLGFLFVGLKLNPREVPSPLIGKPAPAFTLSQLHEPAQTFSPQSMRGRVWLLNVWASWCVACRDEHPLLVDFARSHPVAIVGLNYKDRPEDAQAWLARLGDPYVLSVSDPEGRVGIDFGVYGVPETFLIDSQGIIRHKQIGPVTAEVLQEEILPLIHELEQG